MGRMNAIFTTPEPAPEPVVKRFHVLSSQQSLLFSNFPNPIFQLTVNFSS